MSRYYIEYEIPTAGGHKAKKGIVAYGEKDLEEYCQTIEKTGYKITMVNYHDSEYGEI